MTHQFRIAVTHSVNMGVFGDIKEMSKDSFATFNEVLEVGKEEADISIILGNLFNSSAPSSSGIASALSILNNNVTGQKLHSYGSLDAEDLNFGN